MSSTRYKNFEGQDTLRNLSISVSNGITKDYQSDRCSSKLANRSGRFNGVVPLAILRYEHYPTIQLAEINRTKTQTYPRHDDHVFNPDTNDVPTRYLLDIHFIFLFFLFFFSLLLFVSFCYDSRRTRVDNILRTRRYWQNRDSASMQRRN